MLHALERDLKKYRRDVEATMGHRQIGVASCAVLDELIRRVHAVTAVVPANAPVTPSLIKDHGDDASAIMKFVPATVRTMGGLVTESGETVHAQRQPSIKLIGRIESEGYRVDPENLITVTDKANWSVLDDVDDPGVRVQLEAEKITRAAQAAAYQQRLERMEAAIGQIEAGYAQRIRALTAIGI